MARKKKTAIRGPTKNRWLFVGWSFCKTVFFVLFKNKIGQLILLAGQPFLLAVVFKKLLLVNPKKITFFLFFSRFKKKRSQQPWLASQYFLFAKSHYFQKKRFQNKKQPTKTERANGGRSLGTNVPFNL